MNFLFMDQFGATNGLFLDASITNIWEHIDVSGCDDTLDCIPVNGFAMSNRDIPQEPLDAQAGYYALNFGGWKNFQWLGTWE